jgi:hypothetical protein
VCGAQLALVEEEKYLYNGGKDYKMVLGCIYQWAIQSCPFLSSPLRSLMAISRHFKNNFAEETLFPWEREGGRGKTILAINMSTLLSRLRVRAECGMRHDLPRLQILSYRQVHIILNLLRALTSARASSERRIVCLSRHKPETSKNVYTLIYIPRSL